MSAAPPGGVPARPVPAAAVPAAAVPAAAVPAARSHAESLADAAAKAALYGRLSRTAAAARDVRVAVSAAWAADVHLVQALLWERSSADDLEAHGRFLAVGAAVGSAVGAHDGAHDGAQDARAVVVAARRRMLAAFDPPAAALICARLGDLEHLAELPAPATAGPRPAGALSARIAGRPAADAAADLRTTAGDCRAVARALGEAGYARDGSRQAHLGDVAEIEAYLIEASLAVGDVDLLVADLRRAALAEVLPPLDDLPGDAAAVRVAVRAALRAVLPPAEVARVAERFAAAAAPATGPAATGPAATGLAATGPAASGPASSGPAASGPSASGPAAPGPGARDEPGPAA